MTVYFAAAAVCAALAVLFFLGKGSVLVRGTAGEANEASFFDDKKLRVVCGAGMSVLALLLALSGALISRIVFWLPMAVSVPVCVLLVLLCNTVCALPQPEPWYRRSAGMVFLGLCVALIFVLSTFGKSGTIAVTPGADDFTVRGSFGSGQTVAYGSVRDVSLEFGWDNGTRLRGIDSNRICEGKYRNEQVGAYTMYAYAQCDARVVIRTDTAVLAVNAPTAQQTQALYEELSERVETYAAQ